MSPQQFTLTKRLQALTVEIIRRLWDHGRFHNNAWIQRIHDAWFHHWVDVKTANTMADVDAQALEILEDWEEADAAAQEPVFTEQLDGETLLGGPMQLSHPTLGQFDDLSDE